MDHLTPYAQGFEDRKAGKPMAESFTLSPKDANPYNAGYRAACERMKRRPLDRNPDYWLLVEWGLTTDLGPEAEHRIALRIIAAETLEAAPWP